MQGAFDARPVVAAEGAEPLQHRRQVGPLDRLARPGPRRGRGSGPPAPGPDPAPPPAAAPVAPDPPAPAAPREAARPADDPDRR